MSDLSERRQFAGRIGHAMMVRSSVFEAEATFPRMGFFDYFDEGPAEPPPVERYGTAAVVRITGPLSHHNEWWFDSYDAISERLDRALAASPRPSAIVMILDTPGGDAAGCFELAASMRKRCDSARIPLVAYVEGMACSAGYALLCAASRVVASPASIVGSIGVIACAVDLTGMLSIAGIKVRLIKSGARKADGSPYEPLTREAEGAIQAEVDGLAELFFAHVATHRPMTGGVDAVRALEAGVLLGAAAKAAGLVDDVGTIDTALAVPRVAAPAPAPAPAPATAARAVKRIRMSTIKPRTETETAEPQAAMEECDLAPLRDVLAMPDQPAQEVIDAAVAKIKEAAAEEAPAEAEGEQAKRAAAAEKRAASAEAALASLKTKVEGLSARVTELEPLAVAETKRTREAKVDAALAKAGMSAAADRARFVALAENHGVDAALASIEASRLPPQGTVGGPPAASTSTPRDALESPSVNDPKAQTKAIETRASELAGKPEHAGKPPHVLVSIATRQLRSERPDLFPAA